MTTKTKTGRIVMTKIELATALAEALNILNGLQDQLDGHQQGPIHNLFAAIPENIRDDADFRNNGSITAKQLTR